jgi:hypothetical protein
VVQKRDQEFLNAAMHKVALQAESPRICCAAAAN